MKKTWQAPLLVILTRSKPEEVVLSGCKTIGGATGSPTYTDWACDLANECWQCNAIVSS